MKELTKSFSSRFSAQSKTFPKMYIQNCVYPLCAFAHNIRKYGLSTRRYQQFICVLLFGYNIIELHANSRLFSIFHISIRLNVLFICNGAKRFLVLFLLLSVFYTIASCVVCAILVWWWCHVAPRSCRRPVAAMCEWYRRTNGIWFHYSGLSN